MRAEILGLVAIAMALLPAGCGSAAREQELHARPAARGLPQAEADYDAALALIARQRFNEAGLKLIGLDERFERAGDTGRAAQSMFWLAYCYEKLDRTAEAAELYGRVTQRYPDTPAARQAAERLARLPGGKAAGK
jgi:TolA-binding protein